MIEVYLRSWGRQEDDEGAWWEGYSDHLVYIGEDRKAAQAAYQELQSHYSEGVPIWKENVAGGLIDDRPLARRTRRRPYSEKRVRPVDV